MKRKVIINRLPKAESGLVTKMRNLRAAGGLNAKEIPWPMLSGFMSEPDMSARRTLPPVPRDEANLEAERDEVAMLPTDSGIPETYLIGGKRHSEGGTPLNLPPESFIFSDTKKMRIKDEDMLKRFGLSYKKGGYTPAEIAKRYDVNEYKKVLLDKNSDKLQKKTAERVIQNYNTKLSELALLQESMKGFPQGIPMVGLPYVQKMNFDPSSMFQPQNAPQEQMEQEEMEEVPMEQMEPPMEYGGMLSRLRQLKYGGLPAYQDGNQVIMSPRRTDTVRYDPLTGTYNVYNIIGKKIGVMNVPQNVQSRMVTPQQLFPAQQFFANQMQNAQMQNATTQTPEAKKEVVTTTTTKTKSQLPSDAIIVDSEDDPRITLENIKSGKIYIKKSDGKYSRALKYDIVDASRSGIENYKPIGASAEADLERAEGILKKLESAGKARRGSNKSGQSGWIIEGDAYNALSLDDTEFMTRVSSVGGPKYKDLGFRTPDGKGFDIVLQREGTIGSFGWAHPKFMEYQYWKAQSPVNYKVTAQEFEEMMKNDPNLMAQNRKDMLNFYGFDVSKYDDAKLKQPAETFYTKSMVKGKEGAIDKKTNSEGKLINGEDLGLVRSSQIIFGDQEYRPALGSDNKLGLEHLELLKPGLKLEDPQDLTTTETSEGDDDLEYDKLSNIPNVDIGSPWWLQDIIKTANAAGNLARIKKYHPWVADANIITPDVTFYDPSRELAAAAEQSNIAANTLSRYTGPQAFNARFAQLQGQQAKNAANILSRYNDLNVNVSNQQASQNAQILNQEAQNKALRRTALWDSYQTLNQQFDDSKSKAREALVNQYTNAITNKEYTGNMNQLYPQFAVDPSIGGRMIFKNPRELMPDKTQEKTFTQVYNKLLKENPTADPNKLLDVAYKMYSNTDLYTNPWEQYSKKEGIVPNMYPGMYSSQDEE